MSSTSSAPTQIRERRYQPGTLSPPPGMKDPEVIRAYLAMPLKYQVSFTNAWNTARHDQQSIPSGISDYCTQYAFSLTGERGQEIFKANFSPLCSGTCKICSSHNSKSHPPSYTVHRTASVNSSRN